MRKRIGLPAAVLTAALLATGAAAGEEKTYGRGLGDAEPVPIASLLKQPDAYVGKHIRVTGRIADVCPKRGCWVDIAADGQGQVVRFKVEDGVIVFPQDAKGLPVTAEGVFKRIEMTREQAVGWAAHLAEERGEPFDEATADIARVLYQIEGRGAVTR